MFLRYTIYSNSIEIKDTDFTIETPIVERDIFYSVISYYVSKTTNNVVSNIIRAICLTYYQPTTYLIKYMERILNRSVFDKHRNCVLRKLNKLHSLSPIQYSQYILGIKAIK